VLPTGYTSFFEPALRPYVGWLLRKWQQNLEAASDTRPWVVAPYFYLAPWVTRFVPDNRLIYYNLDEYTLYRPDRTETIQRQETELVEHAAHTVCLSVHQVRTLRERHPDRAGAIHHFPLGVDERFIHPDPTRPPEPGTVGYVGNLSDRVDWFLVRSVAERCPDLTFRFAGSAGPPGPDAPAWERARADAFDLPNVEHLGRIPQEDVTDVYWSSAVNWIPYDPDHPFNVASCPTKVMDTIASGRPVVSAPVPECTLYPDWIEIVETPDAAADALREAILPSARRATRAQVAFAREQTWNDRARELQYILHGRPVPQ